MFEITITAFENNYIYPADVFSNSKWFTRAIQSGRIIKLHLPESMKPAFEWIHQRVHEKSLEFPIQYFEDIYLLAERMQIEIIFEDIYQAIRLGKFTKDTLVRYYPLYHPNLKLRNAALNQILYSKFT